MVPIFRDRMNLTINVIRNITLVGHLTAVRHNVQQKLQRRSLVKDDHQQLQKEQENQSTTGRRKPIVPVSLPSLATS